MYVPEKLSAFYSWNISSDEPDVDTSFKTWRNLKLDESDFMALSDVPNMTTDWVTFRQALRDLPSNSNYPADLVDPRFVPLDPDGK